MTVLPILLALTLPQAQATSFPGPEVVAATPLDLTEDVPPNVVPRAWVFGVGNLVRWGIVESAEATYEVPEDSVLADMVRIWDEEGREVPADRVLHRSVVSLYPHRPLAEGHYVLSEEPPELPFVPISEQDTASINFQNWRSSRFMVVGAPDHRPPPVPTLDAVTWTDERGADALEASWSVAFRWAAGNDFPFYVLRTMDADGKPMFDPLGVLHTSELSEIAFRGAAISPTGTSFEIQAMDLAGNLSEPVRVGPDDGLYQIESPGCSHISSLTPALWLWLPMLGLWRSGRGRRWASVADVR